VRKRIRGKRTVKTKVLPSADARED